MEQAKLIRCQRKAVITCHLGNLERFVADEDVEEKVQKLEQCSAFLKILKLLIMNAMFS